MPSPARLQKRAAADPAAPKGNGSGVSWLVWWFLRSFSNQGGERILEYCSGETPLGRRLSVARRVMNSFFSCSVCSSNGCEVRDVFRRVKSSEIFCTSLEGRLMVCGRKAVDP